MPATLDDLGVEAEHEGKVSLESFAPPPTTTTRTELWAYYLYFVGNHGLPALYFGPSQFQNLIYLAGYDPTKAPFTSPCLGSRCVLPYLGRTRDVNSAVLLTNGLSFVLQAVLFLIVGSWADYGNWRQTVTTLFTLLTIAVCFSWLAADSPEHWHAAVALYILGSIATQCSLIFYSAAFPKLARDLPEVQQSLSEANSGNKTLQEHEVVASISRNRIINTTFAVSCAGQVIVLGIIIGILKALGADKSIGNNTRSLSVVIAFLGGVCVLCTTPWFFLEQKRPGLTLPPGTNIFSIGFVQLYAAARECLRLKQTFIYLAFYFLMGDVLNTTVTVITTLQFSIAKYSSIELTLLSLVGGIAQALGLYIFWRVQKRFEIKTKSMLAFNAFWIIILTGWGLIGIWTDAFGFKHLWEIWLYQIFNGLVISPWYTYSQTLISEVSPAPRICLFFALFSIIGRTSAFIGPFVSSAIITASNNNHNMPFAFLFGLGIFSTFFLWLLDVDASRKECDEFVAAESARHAFKSTSAGRI